MQTSVNSF